MPSWEPDENVKDCTRLLESFWKHIGLDDKDYPAGYEVEAKPRWIGKSSNLSKRHPSQSRVFEEKEKRYFAEEYIRTQNLEKTRKAEEKAKRKKEKAEAKELVRMGFPSRWHSTHVRSSEEEEEITIARCQSQDRKIKGKIE